jgi:hypothetical protein
MPVHVRHLFRLLLLAIMLGGCAHYDGLAVGEALTVADGRRAAALAVEVAEGSGQSSQKGSLFTEARGRALVSGPRQQLAGLVGVSQLCWIGSDAPIWWHVGIGPGLERASLRRGQTIFFDAIAQGRIGTAFVLGEEIAPYAYEELNPWGVEANPNPPPAQDLEGLLRGKVPGRRFFRNRALLTLAIAGDVDARFTRDPLYVVSLMIGVARLEEVRER